MKIGLISFSFLVFFLTGKSQNCEMIPVNDTLKVSQKEKLTSGEFIQTVLKNNSIVQFYKINSNKFYLKLILTENLYFDKTDVLEIQSNGKSFYEKNITQRELTKTTGYFIVEIYKNYIATLKDEGITSIVFGKVETDFTKRDASQIKQIAKCFYENITLKK